MAQKADQGQQQIREVRTYYRLSIPKFAMLGQGTLCEQSLEKMRSAALAQQERSKWWLATIFGFFVSGCGPRVPVTTAHSPGVIAPVAGGVGRRFTDLKLTLYHLAEPVCPDPAEVDLASCDGRRIAGTSVAFKKHLTMQGSGRLCDGRVVSVRKVRAAGAGGICFGEAPAGHPWGSTASGRAAEPFRSIAADSAIFPMGSVWYSPELSKIHTARHVSFPGCVRVDDRGASVKGRHIDWFVGSQSELPRLRGMTNVPITLEEPMGRCGT